MTSDVDLKKTFTISADDAEGLLNMAFLIPEYDDESNTRQAELFRDECLRLLSLKPDKIYNCIVDITPMGKLGYVSKGGGEVYRDLAANKQINKIAIVGNTDFQNAILEFAFFLIKTFNRRVSWFSSREEAVYWLNK